MNNKLVTQKSTNIDLIKTISCIMIVVLHVIENSGDGSSLPIYLTGCYGIPLFLMVNGFLLYERDFSCAYIKRKILAIVKFILLWSISLGTLKSFVRAKFSLLSDIFGAFVGNGLLYHFWFLSALIIVYIGLFIINKYVKVKTGGGNIHKIINKKLLIVIIIMLSLVFITRYYFPFIREHTIRPFRIITNYSYFLLGMFCYKFWDKIKQIKKTILISCILSSYILIYILSLKFNLIWASYFYEFPGCTIGSITIFILALKINITKKIIPVVKSFAASTLCIYVIHPMLRNILNKIVSYLFSEVTLSIRIIETVIIFIIGIFVSSFFLNKKYMRNFVSLK